MIRVDCELCKQNPTEENIPDEALYEVLANHNNKIYRLCEYHFWLYETLVRDGKDPCKLFNQGLEKDAE